MTADRPRRPTGPLRIGSLVLLILGATQLCFGGLAAPAMAFGATSMELGPWIQLGRAGFVGLVYSTVAAVIGLISMVVSAGLTMDQKWAWYLGVLLGVAYIPSGCFPVGVGLLLVLLEPGCRQYFLWKPDPLYTQGVDRHV